MCLHHTVILPASPSLLYSMISLAWRHTASPPGCLKHGSLEYAWSVSSTEIVFHYLGGQWTSWYLHCVHGHCLNPYFPLTTHVQTVYRKICFNGDVLISCGLEKCLFFFCWRVNQHVPWQLVSDNEGCMSMHYLVAFEIYCKLQLNPRGWSCQPRKTGDPGLIDKTMLPVIKRREHETSPAMYLRLTVRDQCVSVH